MWRRYIDKVFSPTLLKKHFLQVIKFIKVNIIKNPKKYNDILIISPSLIGYLRFTKGLSNHKNSAGIKFDIEKNMDNKSVNISNNKNGIWFLFLILYIKFSSKKYPAKKYGKNVIVLDIDIKSLNSINKPAKMPKKIDILNIFFI